MAKNKKTIEERLAIIRANIGRGDYSEAARIMSSEKHVPTQRDYVRDFVMTGRSPLAMLYLDCLETAQVRRIDKAAKQSTTTTTRHLQPA